MSGGDVKEPRKLGFFLGTSPDSQNTSTVIHLSRAAIAKGIKVLIFLMGEGIYNLNHQELMDLLNEGVQFYLCQQNAIERGSLQKEGVIQGSQYDLAHIVHQVDRFLAFT